MMFILGITGGIGSGKTTAANYFLKKGAVIFDADEEAKYLIQSEINIQNQIINLFGSSVITNGKIDVL